MTNITPLDFDPNRRDRDERRPHLRGVPEEREQSYQGIGTEFAAARLQTGMDIGQVATTLRIRKEHLAAIEEGRFADLPAPAYALGFVRSYADFLGLDAAAAVEAFKQETSTSRRRTPLVFPTAEPMERMPRGWLLGLSAVLAAVVFGAWYYSERAGQAVVERIPTPGTESVTRTPAAPPPTVTAAPAEVRAAPVATPPQPNDDAIARVLGTIPATAAPVVPTAAVPPANVPTQAAVAAAATRAPTVPAAPTPAAPAAAPAPAATTTPAAPATEAAAEEPEEPTGSEPQVVLEEIAPPAPQPAAAPEPLVTAPAILAPAAPATTVAAAVPPPAIPPAATPAAIPAADVPPAVPGDVATLTGGAQVFGAPDGRVVVLAKQDSWVQVTGAAGELLLTRILRAGDKYIAPAREDLFLMTGNAGALEVLVDGTALPPLGPVGTVRRNVSLSPEKLLNGTAIQP